MTRSPIRPEIAALAPYHVQPSAGMIKLDAMENPFPFPESLRQGLADALASASLNRYPDAGAEPLKAAVRDAMQIASRYEILLGNGSDEIIQMIAMACAKRGAAILSVEPAFVMFKIIATFCGMRYVGVPLNADFSLDIAAMLDAIKRAQPAVTFIAYPNNPTGTLFKRDEIRRIMVACQDVGGIVVVDEAYFAFSSETMLDEIGDFPNAMLMRTVSKLGLAGIRLGMLIAPKKWTDEIEKVRLPYNINVLTQTAAMFAMQHYGAFTRQAQELVRERANLEKSLKKIAGINAFPSDANFILVSVPNAQKTFDGLLARKILIKNTSKAHPLLANTLRITVGTHDENAVLITALTDILA